ncbi:MAG: sigma-70 family RNA polymerase sigma factor [Muribaculaceae bacterium]|nr:sigma-70 family RNA polymerase sigma factor [Muribaculaceae bacterium]
MMTEQEFRQRVLPLQRLMYGVALKTGLPPDDAADAVQETQVRLWRRRDRIPDNDAELKLYCMAALRNECISTLRRRKPSVALEEAEELKTPEEESSAEYRDTRRRIETLIDSLPGSQGKVIRMSSFGGLDNAEIARATGNTENNVRQLLSRGRRRLRELLASTSG